MTVPMRTLDCVQASKAFADESRVEILHALRGGEMCGRALMETLGISQSTLSYHMSVLCGAELVSAKRDGRWVRYSINSEGVARVQRALGELLNEFPA